MIFRKLEKNKKNIYRFDNLEIRTNSQEAKNINNNKGIPAKRYSFFLKSTKKNNAKRNALKKIKDKIGKM